MLHGTHSPRLTRIQHLGIHPGRFTAGTWEYTPWKRKSIWTKPSWLQVRLLNLPGVYTSCFIRIPTMGYNKPYNKGWCDPLHDLKFSSHMDLSISIFNQMKTPWFFQKHQSLRAFDHLSTRTFQLLMSTPIENAQVTNRLGKQRIQVSTKVLSKLKSIEDEPGLSMVRDVRFSLYPKSQEMSSFFCS